jgi:enoyl-CoA hydratase/carnithine racemase
MARYFSTANRLVTTQILPSRVALITLHNPLKFNALTEAMGDELGASFSSLERQVSAVVLTGAGAAFSAGGDLDFLRARARATPVDNVTTMVAFYKRFLLPLRHCPVPVVCAVNGAAVGAGACLASAADARIVAAGAKVGWTFTSGVAIHPGMGATFYLPKLVGPAAAADLLLGGQLVSGSRAAALGWGEGAVDAGACVDRAVALATQWAAGAPVAVRATVATLRAAADAGLDAALQREAEAQAACYTGPDFVEGVESVAGKRKAAWKEY